MNLNEMTASSVFVFLAWAFAVRGIAKAVFHSMPADRVRHWLASDYAKAADTFRLQVELEAGRSGNAPLDREGIDRRIQMIRRLQPALWRSCLMWFLACSFCQEFWTAAISLSLFCGIGVERIPSWFAIATLATALDAALNKREAGRGARSGSCNMM